MKKKRFFKVFVSLGFTCILAVGFLLLSESKTYQSLELKTFDFRFTLRKDKLSQAPILNIDIDDQSIMELGRWPWPRNYHAKLIDILTECGAEQVVMDILFVEKQEDNNNRDDLLFADAMRRSDRTYLPFYFAEDKEMIFPGLKRLLSEDITVSLEEAAETLNCETDSLRTDFFSTKNALLNQALRRIVKEAPESSLEDVFCFLEEEYGWFLFSGEEAYVRKHFPSEKQIGLFVDRFAFKHKDSDILRGQKYTTPIIPIEEYIGSIKGSGFINADPDQDGVLRRVPLVLKYGEKLVPQLSVAALMYLLRVKEIAIKRDVVIFKDAHINNKIKNIAIPVDEKGCMLINWQGKWAHSFRHVPYFMILRLQKIREKVEERQCENNKNTGLAAENAALITHLKNVEKNFKQKLTDIIQNKICIIGLTATGTQDMGPMPFQSDYPLVGTHSNLINTVITEDFIKKAPPYINMFIFFFTALAIGFGSLVKLWKSLLLSVCYASGYFFIAFLVFDKLGIWVDVVGPLGIIVFGFSGIMSLRFFTEEREKLWIKKAFGRYISKDVINELIDDPSKLKLGGERRVITVLFSDIKGFTTYSEKKAPEEAVSILNEYLDVMTKVIFDNKGTLDKYMGDGIMAIFGAPHYEEPEISAKRAVKTAWQMMEKLMVLQDEWIGRGLQPLDIGIGINTGEMIVGNVGSTLVMNYTVIGDAVNLGSRIEGLTRRYNNNIMISEFTYKYVKNVIEAKPLETIKVKGKTISVMMYEIVGLKPE